MKLNIICYFAQNNKSIIILDFYFRFSSMNFDLQFKSYWKESLTAQGDALLEIFYFLHASCWFIAD